MELQDHRYVISWDKNNFRLWSCFTFRYKPGKLSKTSFWQLWLHQDWQHTMKYQFLLWILGRKLSRIYNIELICIILLLLSQAYSYQNVELFSHASVVKSWSMTPSDRTYINNTCMCPSLVQVTTGVQSVLRIDTAMYKICTQQEIHKWQKKNWIQWSLQLELGETYNKQTKSIQYSTFLFAMIKLTMRPTVHSPHIVPAIHPTHDNKKYAGICRSSVVLFTSIKNVWKREFIKLWRMIEVFEESMTFMHL